MDKIKKYGFKLEHIGINAANNEEAKRVAELLEAAFSFNWREGRSSIFAGDNRIEIMKKPGYGHHGHLAIGVDDIDEAQNLLERKGWKFREDTRVVKDGQTVAIYLEREIAGFAIHLLQRK